MPTNMGIILDADVRTQPEKVTILSQKKFQKSVILLEFGFLQLVCEISYMPANNEKNTFFNTVKLSKVLL